jgi:hypothetical protein
MLIVRSILSRPNGLMDPHFRLHRLFSDLIAIGSSFEENSRAVADLINVGGVMKKFRSPLAIQQFLNGLEYRVEGGARSPLIVEQTHLANCFDGAVYAAAALEILGYPPLIVDMEAKNDDDHVIAVYHSGGWGAIAKSNTTMLRSREPVYRSVRELVMSYFDGYFNIDGYRSLRTYAVPINLRRFDSISWRTTSDWLDPIQTYLHKVRHYPVLTRKMARVLNRAEPFIVQACFLNSNRKGIYRTKQ